MSKNGIIFDIRMAITPLSKSKAKELKKLSSKKERDLSGLFLAEGEKCVYDLLATFDPVYLIATNEFIGSRPDLVNKYEDKIFSSDKRGIEIISSLKSLPDVIAVFRKPYFDLNNLKLNKDQFYLLLDDIQDPGNLGTIIRTCDWFGVYLIFASENTVDVWGPKVIQATMGSLSRVRVIYTDLKRLIIENSHCKIIGTLLEGRPIGEIRGQNGGLIIMGNEGRGISENLKKLIDLPITIPPVNSINHPDSLNVSIATAIVLSHIISDSSFS